MFRPGSIGALTDPLRVHHADGSASGPRLDQQAAISS
jgi:hypothetical protein